jgi:hypothetical protein
MQTGGWENVKRHAWFAEIDWRALGAGQLAESLHVFRAAAVKPGVKPCGTLDPDYLPEAIGQDRHNPKP